MRFSPGFPSGAGFPGEEFAPAKIREKTLSGKSSSKEIRASEVSF
jgi:hypothetical protein